MYNSEFSKVSCMSEQTETIYFPQKLQNASATNPNHK